MTSALTQFSYGGSQMRVIDHDGSPWWVAQDVAAILGYSVTAAMTRSLDEDEKGLRNLHTLGGTQSLTVINEAGLYSAIMRSRVDGAKRFKRWVTHEVLPAIRSHGAYLTPARIEEVLTDPDTIIRIATDLKEERARRVALESEVAAKSAELEAATPKAAAWDTFLSATGDMSVYDAAKALARADIAIGGQRLFRWMLANGWCFRGPDSSPRALQARIDAGYLTHKPQGHYHPQTGEWVLDAPQVRVKPKGLALLAKRIPAPEEVTA